MASKDTRLNIEITAQDRASEVVRDVQSDVDKLEQSDATVDVAANDDASKVIDDVGGDARDLDGTKATVAVEADDNASRKIDSVESDARDLDGRKATVTVEVDDNASGKLDGIQGKLSGLGGAGDLLAAGGAAGGAAAVGGALANAVLYASDLAIKTQAVADATGAPLDKASRLVTVWEQNGFQVEDLIDLISQVNQTLVQTPDLKQQLNIGGATDLIDQFLLAVQGLQTQIDTPGSRNVLGSQLFGEEGARQLQIVQTRVGDIQGAMDALGDNVLINPDDVERSRELAANMALVQQRMTQIKLELAQGILPLLDKWANHPAIGSLVALSPLATGVALASQYAPGVPDSLDPRNLWDHADYDPLANLPTGRAPRGRASGGNLTIVNNPPGSPTTITDAGRIYTRRNDARLS
jgi:hypothetical protein